MACPVPPRHALLVSLLVRAQVLGSIGEANRATVAAMDALAAAMRRELELISQAPHAHLPESNIRHRARMTESALACCSSMMR
eukprot:6194250-Pleurochrysis_carterae.AAC.1